MATVFHERVIELAIRTNEASEAKFKGHSNDIVHDAVFILTHDAICVHRAIGKLVDSGWPSPASILLRTMLDFAVSGLAVSRSKEPTLAAFKFMYSGARKVSRGDSFSPEVRRDSRQQIKSRVAMLPERIRVQASEFLSEKERAYWFIPEWKRPSDVLARFAPREIQDLYSMLSGPAHGSFLGMRIFREDPDAHNINPELPPGRKAMSVDLASARLLLVVLGIRASTEGLSELAEIGALTDEITEAVARLPLHGAV